MISFSYLVVVTAFAVVGVNCLPMSLLLGESDAALAKLFDMPESYYDPLGSSGPATYDPSLLSLDDGEMYQPIMKRSQAKLLRVGRSGQGKLLRVGRSQAKLLRVGRSQAKLLRVGRSGQAKLLRVGRR